MGHDFFTTASFGKRVEYTVIAKMLRAGLDVYLPMVDDKGIDCLVRKNDGSVAGIQIKGRSRNCGISSAGRFSAISIQPRPNYYIIFYSEACGNGAIWLMRTLDFASVAIRNKKGKNLRKSARFSDLPKGWHPPARVDCLQFFMMTPFFS